MSFEFKKYTWLYTSTLQAIQEGYPLVVHQGGTSSSKTYSIVEVLFSLALNDPGSVSTVVGQDIPNLKKGPIRDAKNILAEEPELGALFKYNKSERIYENIETGSLIEFNSYDDEQDAKSGRRDYSFFNEANGIPYPVFDAIKVRTKKATIIDFNPNARFWAHEKILPDKANRKWFISTFRNNPFIDEKVKRDILSYEPTPENIARGTANKYKWQVYGLGQTGRLEGLVFPDFKVTAEWPESQKWYVHGLDFGFTNDPTALVEVKLHSGGLYWKELIYETGLTNVSENEDRQPSIHGRLHQLEFNRRDLISADSAEPKSIQELSNKGWYIQGAEKGKDSVNQGIDAIKRYPIYIHGGSKNLIDEFNSYTWAKDKDGNPTNKPIDAWNHGIDGGRYGLSTHILNERKPLSTALV